MENLEELEEIIQNLTTDDEKEFIALTLKLLKGLVLLFNNFPDLQEDFKDYEDIYQISIMDINLQFWFEISKGILSYELGQNDNNSIIVILNKDVFIQTIQKKIQGFDAYMKGKIRIQGDLRFAIRLRNLIKSLSRYMSYMIKEGFNFS
ncbi:MAG: SCP2 sterol-binding domain-containing protein [Candidatus Lokiarchaeota archaeon]